MCTGYVLGKYAKLGDVIKLNWLPVHEYIEYSTVKYAFHALTNSHWPTYLHTDIVKHSGDTRSCQDGPKIQYEENFTFQNQAKSFNDLPKSIREQKSFSTFSSQSGKKPLLGFYLYKSFL